MQIIQQSWTEESETYALFFQLRGESEGSGFAFDCDAEGNVLPTKAGSENLRKCLSGEHNVEAPYVETFSHRYRHPRIGRCDCGSEVSLGHFTNTCGGCGADYNSSGQRLAPRECWGEETGEHWTECV